MKFVAVPYTADQNAPSKPNGEIYEANTLEEIEKLGRELFEEVFMDPVENRDQDDIDEDYYDIRELVFEDETRDEISYGDYSVSDGDSFIYLTIVRDRREIYPVL